MLKPSPIWENSGYVPGISFDIYKSIIVCNASLEMYFRVATKIKQKFISKFQYQKAILKYMLYKAL